MELERYKKGQFVISRAGRDKGRLLIVVELIDEAYVRVVDGDLRKAAHPKLKKMMHLNVVNYSDQELNRVLESGTPLTDAQIRKCIEQYQTKDEPSRRDL